MATCVVTHHEPLTLATAMSTLDLRSGGRFLFGVGEVSRELARLAALAS